MPHLPANLEVQCLQVLALVGQLARQRDALDALDIDPAALATNTALLRVVAWAAVVAIVVLNLVLIALTVSGG